MGQRQHRSCRKNRVITKRCRIGCNWECGRIIGGQYIALEWQTSDNELASQTLISRGLSALRHFQVDNGRASCGKRASMVKLQQQPLQILLERIQRPASASNREEIRHQLWQEDTVAISITV